MPACINCHRFDPRGPRCTVEEGTPGRKCVIASLEHRLKKIHGQQVCEIGPGAWMFAKNILDENGNTWFGIDPKTEDHKARKVTATHRGTVACIPLKDNSMDYVLANQSMEHWHEYGTSFRKGLREIHRVLKPGGQAILNVPIHRHGHEVFLKGQMKRIRSLFTSYKWSDVYLEEWRKDYQPLEQWKGWLADKRLSGSSVPNAATASTWILEIVLTKAERERWGIREELLPFWIDLKTMSHWGQKRLRSRLRIKDKLKRLLGKV